MYVVTPDVHLTVRSVELGPVEEIDRHYLRGNPVWTHMCNRLFVATGELEVMVVRWARDTLRLDELQDPVLRRQLEDFFAQEAAHARHHRAGVRMLRAQGYEVDTLLARLRARLTEVSQSWTPVQAMCVVAGLEHHFTSMGVHVLREDPIPDMPAPLHALMMWHAAEEVEHQSVAFDAMQALYQPSYLQRMVGFARATHLAFSTMHDVFLHLVAQEEPAISRARMRREMRSFFLTFAQSPGRLLANTLRYAVPGFHPLDDDTRGLARAWFEAHPYPTA